MTETQKVKRLQFARWIRKNFSASRCEKIMFSDEKLFDGDGQFNRKNDIVYAPDRETANEYGGLVPTHKHPFKVMVWVGITFHGATKVVVLPRGGRFNSDFYCQKVIPIIQRYGTELIGDDFVLQQDGASCHRSAESLEAFAEHDISIIPPNRWPPNSPDLNPLDYFFWSEVKRELVKKKYKNRAQLVRQIKTSEISLEKRRDSIRNFPTRVREVEKNLGGLILNKHF